MLRPACCAQDGAPVRGLSNQHPQWFTAVLGSFPDDIYIIDFCFCNSSQFLQHFCHFSNYLPGDFSFAQMGSLFAQTPTLNPCSEFCSLYTPFGDKYVRNNSPAPNPTPPHPKTPLFRNCLPPLSRQPVIPVSDQPVSCWALADAPEVGLVHLQSGRASAAA